ncbi:MAG: hypothetical protein NTZ05_23375 [Chloroflexi bacterium]|nr:hypothetical protein [Chloroflexota bacterium]
MVAARRVLSLAQVGRTTEALARLNEMLRGAVEREQEATPTVMLNYLLEAAVLLEEQAAAVRLAGWLAPMADRYESGSASTVGRSLGAAMALLGQPERARQYYAQGQAVAEKLRHRPELALIALGLAELEATEGNIAAARERLAFCIPEFEAMGMRPALEKAMGLRDSLEGE